MSRNLIRLTYRANKDQAISDWCDLAVKAIESGKKELAEQHVPPKGASLRKIDQCIASLRKALEQQS